MTVVVTELWAGGLPITQMDPTVRPTGWRWKGSEEYLRLIRKARRETLTGDDSYLRSLLDSPRSHYVITRR